MTIQAPAPRSPGDRHEVLDALRGLALFGILIVNLEGFSLLWAFPPDHRLTFSTAAFDPTVSFLRSYFLDGKFYSIFSLLFGIGFALQLVGADQRGDGTLRRFRRRLLILLGIGVAHIWLLWDGDILVLYALTGFLLIPFRHTTDRMLLRWAVALLLAPVVVQAIRLATGGATDPMEAIQGLAIRVDQWVTGVEEPDWATMIVQGGWREFYLSRVSGPLWRLADLIHQVRLPKVLAMFVLGLWVGRRIRLDQLALHAPLLRRVATVGLALGLAGNLAMSALATFGHSYDPSLGGLAHATAYAVGVAPMAMGYAAGFALLFEVPRWRRKLLLLAPVGRMALTNYLAQSIICTLIFHGMGLGLGGRVGPSGFVALALIIFPLQVAWSGWWLARFRFGPMEWLWRSLTQGRAQPMRSPPRAAAESP